MTKTRVLRLSANHPSCYHRGKLGSIVDPFLTGKIAPESLKKFGEIAVNCLRDDGIERPSMEGVVGDLEFALQLQESRNERKSAIGGTGDDDAVDLQQRRAEF
ncbi:Receptor-like protein kinase FERONIA [Morella rubra]|uniref:Receptor-like protein kinase FERONIA n=1 Tax=Morella rubra TaxID=262757 RepID=A0A6A1VFE4_9ROSI|nr:Receptor-like protein kinase FERONIA [Morella rubra]